MSALTIPSAAMTTETQLWEACTLGDHDTVSQLLQSGPIDINWADPDHNRTALYRACGHGHAEVVALLLQVPGIDVNRAQTQGVSPFFVACCEGYPEVVELLLRDPRVDVSQTRDTKSTPFSAACERGHLAVVELLLADPRIDVNQFNQTRTTPLWFASQEGHLPIIKAMLASNHHFDTTIRTLPGGKLWSDCDAAEQAARNDHHDVAQLLARFQANPEQVRFELRKELGILDGHAADLFATIVFVCDSHLALCPKQPQEQEQQVRARRFLGIVERIPMELQMTVANRVFGLTKDAISVAHTEVSLRRIAAAF